MFFTSIASNNLNNYNFLQVRNSCFANSILQTLTHATPLQEYLNGVTPPEHKCGQGICFTCHLRDFVMVTRAHR